MSGVWCMNVGRNIESLGDRKTINKATGVDFVVPIWIILLGRHFIWARHMKKYGFFLGFAAQGLGMGQQDSKPQYIRQLG